jgi:hypothetical protein
LLFFKKIKENEKIEKRKRKRYNLRLLKWIKSPFLLLFWAKKGAKRAKKGAKGREKGEIYAHKGRKRAKKGEEHNAQK